VDEDGFEHIWETRSGKSVFAVHAKDPGYFFVGVVWSPDGRYLVTGGLDRTAQVRETGSWRLLSSFDMQQGAVDRIAVSPDGRLVVTGSTSEAYGVPVDRTGPCLGVHDGTCGG
jgi:WD40 repeat protein